MDILIAHNLYQQPGGEDECVAAETAMLEAHGHRIIRYSVSNDAIAAMQCLDLAARTLWSKTAYRELTALLRSHRPQIVHFHNTFPLISPSAYYAARQANVRVVQTLHNFRLLCANALLYRDGKVCEDCVGRSFGWPGIVRKCYRRSLAATSGVVAMNAFHRAMGTWERKVDVYIALTAFARSKLIEGGISAERIAVKPNFVHPDTGTGNGHGDYGLYVGRLSVEKGIETLLDAWQRLRCRVPLKIIGDGPMRALVQQAAVRNPDIQWLGRRSREDVDALMGNATFVVLPSHCYETFGRVIIESYAKGTPVIASRLGAMAELVDDGRTGLLFNPADASDLASKVSALLSNKYCMAELRSSARLEFARHFTRDANYTALMTIYERALNLPQTT